MPEVVLNGFSLTRDQVCAVSRREQDDYARVTLDPAAHAHMREVRSMVERDWLQDRGKPIYGFNTGVGVLKDRQVPGEKLDDFQKHYIDTHCVGVGRPFDQETVRAAILVRANSLASGHSGVRPELVHALLQLLNSGIHPAVPEVGSLGASGDLAQLAHVGAVLTGEPEAQILSEGSTIRLRDLDPGRRPSPLVLAPKEAMALTNGTSFMLAILALITVDARLLLRQADVVAALSVEAVLGEEDAFDARLQVVRPHPGQEASARNFRRLFAGGEATGEDLRLEYLRRKVSEEIGRMSDQVRAEGIDPESLLRYRVAVEHLPRVQDAYSLRCAPQVHGASRDALDHVISVVDRELNAVTDNPLIFREGDGYRPLSGGNFHGQPLALAADYACMALAEMGSISERRLYRLLNSDLSYGLPPNLTGGEPGINTGLMIVQYTAAALVSESKSLSHPAVVDSIPSSGDQEDHVSMGLWAARKARMVLENSRRVLSLELLAAVQGLDLQERVLGRSRRLSPALGAARRVVRGRIAVLQEDRYLPPDLESVHQILHQDTLLPAVEECLGGVLE